MSAENDECDQEMIEEPTTVTNQSDATTPSSPTTTGTTRPSFNDFNPFPFLSCPWMNANDNPPQLNEQQKEDFDLLAGILAQSKDTNEMISAMKQFTDITSSFATNPEAGNVPDVTSGAGFNPFAFHSGMDGKGAPPQPVTEQQKKDLEKLAEVFAKSQDTNEMVSIMKEFTTTYPQADPGSFVEFFSSKMNELTKDIPEEQMFKKMMIMLEAFAASDPMIGKAMASMGEFPGQRKS